MLPFPQDYRSVTVTEYQLSTGLSGEFYPKCCAPQRPIETCTSPLNLKKYTIKTKPSCMITSEVFILII